ncbi:HD domain-containing phosphohydrolase [Undibacterium curvum]|uniref:HD domain-containing protein n=1 Tax=Undibacterium curvum TaxID=2762294 RepID=A0ABR6ZZT6_9BURK|nr:HD domain-containing phosphohydrolase [Undibacterium curvum]MBC3930180.1 HD domain-containing protein [Undibacterium curvum]
MPTCADVMMPDKDGYEVCRMLKENPVTKNIPIIFITAMNEIQNGQKGLALGAVDYITKPISAPIVLSRIRTHLALYQQNIELERKVQERTLELQKTNLAVIQRLARAGEFKDNETGRHVIRMTYYSRLIASKITQDESWIELVFHSSAMHDIGKIGVPDKILLKNGKLDTEEWSVMISHPMMGAQIIGEHASDLLTMAREIAQSHHEKWDGSGYSFKFKVEQIPLAGRIVAVADVFDALTSERPYKKAWPIEEAYAHLLDQSGKHFDPKLVEVFIASKPEVEEIMHKYAEVRLSDDDKKNCALIRKSAPRRRNADFTGH